MNRLRAFRNDRGLERWSAWTEWPLIVLSLVFLVVLILPLARPLPPGVSRGLDLANVVIWAAFAVDYLARLWLAQDRSQFVKSHVVDLMVVAVPFLRPFRLLRLVAIVMAASRRAGGLAVQRVTVYVVGLTVIVISVAAVVVYNQERTAPEPSIRTLGEAFWWAAETVTTVGYGDAVPTTPTGRLFAVLLMVTGIALVGTITAAVAAWFVNLVRQSATAESEAQAEDDRAALSSQIARLTEVVEHLSGEVAALRIEGRQAT